MTSLRTPGDSRGTSGSTTAPTATFVRKAYIEFTLPKIGTFTVGKQPVTLGYGLAFSDSLGNLDGLKWSNKWGPVGVSAMYFKWDDNVVLGGASEFYNRDSDIWRWTSCTPRTTNHTIELFGGYAKFGAGMPEPHDWPYNWIAADDVNANLGFVGIAYTGEIDNMITVKGEVSGLFGQADLADWGGPMTRSTAGSTSTSMPSYHNDLLTGRRGLRTGQRRQHRRLNDDDTTT